MNKRLSLSAILMCFSWAASAQIPETEYNALVALYNSTNGLNWTNNTNW
jgi:hypothetical protein